MRVVARRTEGFAHEVEVDDGHRLIVDEPPELGGEDLGPRPTRLLAASLAGCTAITMELYAARKGWELGPVEVEVEVEMERAVPVSFDVHVRLSPDLEPEQRERLLVIANKCPVHKVVAGTVPVTVSEQVEAA
ncbi:MAG: OsmC family protein [Solirubrobacterales bacterium]